MAKPRQDQRLIIASAGLFLICGLASGVAALASGAVVGRDLPMLIIVGALDMAAAALLFLQQRLLRYLPFAMLVLVSISVLSSGGAQSPLWPLYFVVSVESGLTGRYRLTLITSAATVIIAAAIMSPVFFDHATPDRLAGALVLLAVLVCLSCATAWVARDVHQQHRVRGLLEEIFQASAFKSSDDLEAILQSMLGVLRRDSGADYAIVYLLSNDEQYLTPEAVVVAPEFTGEESAVLRSWTVKLTEGITGWVARHGENVLSGDINQDPRSSHIPGTVDVFMSAILVPLKLEGKVAGVLRLSREGLNRFKDADLQMAELFAHYAVFAIQNARLYAETGRLYREMRELSTTDGLTGLHNQRYLSETAPLAVQAARQRGGRLSVLMIDSDCLKQVNDRFGHATGDRFLKELAYVLRRDVRATDTVIRYAGDEFIVLLPDVDALEAQEIAERCRMDAQRIDLGVDIKLAVSIGVATFPDHADDLEELLRAADQALYCSKGAGRNRTSIFSLASY